MSKAIKVVKMPNTYGRYIIINPNTGEILDDAQGYGYRSPQKAHAAWNYKHPSSKSSHNRKVNKQYLKTHKHLGDDWGAWALDIVKNGEQITYSDFKDFMSEYDPDFSGSIRSLYFYVQNH